LKKIHAWQPQLILLDINMPGMNGLKTLEAIRKAPNQDYIAVIFVSANGSTDDIILGLDHGADDYLPKPFRMKELLARVRAKLRIKELHDQLKRATKRLEELVDLDDLTGLYNMRALYRRLDSEILRSARYGKWLSCIMIDMDNFKNVNDDHDHLFGSWVIIQVAQIIKASSRSMDISARYGGDEYIIILPETNQAGAERLAERIRLAVANAHFIHGNDKAKLTCSLGVATLDAKINPMASKEFVRVADQMLYEAKNAGRNCLKAKLIGKPA
jgi:two-component system cell cycle response regulator